MKRLWQHSGRHGLQQLSQPASDTVGDVMACACSLLEWSASGGRGFRPRWGDVSFPLHSKRSTPSPTKPRGRECPIAPATVRHRSNATREVF